MVSPSVANMAVMGVNNILNFKDSRWLQLEVCREFQRGKCTRHDTECKFAHPPSNVEVQNGRVIACYDSIKGRCMREKPPCKYFHPPQHLKDQLLINGRNNLAIKNALMSQIQGINAGTPLIPASTLPVASSPYITAIPTMASYSPYMASSPVMTVSMADASVPSALTGVVPQAVVAQKVPRADRLEAFPGMGIPYKRSAGDKSGVPLYQPAGSTAYQQAALMHQLGGQSYMPVSCEYGGSSASLLVPGTGADLSNTSPAKYTAVASPLHPDPSSSTASSSMTSSTMTTSTAATSSVTTVAIASSESSPQPSSANPSSPLASAALSMSQHCAVVPYAVAKGARTLKPSQANLSAGLGAGTVAFQTPTLTHSASMPGVFGLGAPIPTAGGGIGVSPFASSAATAPVMANLGFGSGAMGIPAAQSAALGSMAGIGPGLTPVAGIGTVMPYVTPSLMYPQYPGSSMMLHQYNAALSNAIQTSWPQTAGEQPYKKLKTL